MKIKESHLRLFIDDAYFVFISIIIIIIFLSRFRPLACSAFTIPISFLEVPFLLQGLSKTCIIFVCSYLSEIRKSFASGVALGGGCWGRVCPTKKYEIRTDIGVTKYVQSTLSANNILGHMNDFNAFDVYVIIHPQSQVAIIQLPYTQWGSNIMRWNYVNWTVLQNLHALYYYY